MRLTPPSNATSSRPKTSWTNSKNVRVSLNTTFRNTIEAVFNFHQKEYKLLKCTRINRSRWYLRVMSIETSSIAVPTRRFISSLKNQCSICMKMIRQIAVRILFRFKIYFRLRYLNQIGLTSSFCFKDSKEPKNFSLSPSQLRKGWDGPTASNANYEDSRTTRRWRL